MRLLMWLIRLGILKRLWQSVRGRRRKHWHSPAAFSRLPDEARALDKVPSALAFEKGVNQMPPDFNG